MLVKVPDLQASRLSQAVRRIAGEDERSRSGSWTTNSSGAWSFALNPPPKDGPQLREQVGADVKRLEGITESASRRRLGSPLARHGRQAGGGQRPT